MVRRPPQGDREWPPDRRPSTEDPAMIPEVLNDPAFVEYVHTMFPTGVEPDDQDLPPGCWAGKLTDKHAAELYSMAQAARLLRLRAEWEASQN